MSKPFLYFDIETGDINPENASILSISHSRGDEKKTLYAKPSGSISDWALKNVWEPIKQRLGAEPSFSEEEILKSFLGTIQSQKGGTIAGWNVGYVATPMTKGTKGFDIPFIMSRAKKYGLDKDFGAAFGDVSIRDIGRETSVRIAQEVSKHPTLVDPKLYAQAKSFTKLVNINTATQRLNSVPEIAEWMGTPGKYGGYEVAGWKLGTVHEQLFGESFSGAHLSEEDVAATRRIAEQGDFSRLQGPEYITKWNTAALANKAAASARARKLEGGIGGAFYARAAARAAENPWLKRAGTVIGEHKLGFGIALGIGALLAVKPLQYFSGKDDEYNTIEGLKHGGEAEKMRHRMTDFGSGWIRKALSKGISREQVISAGAKLGLEKQVMAMPLGISKILETKEGGKWMLGRTLGKGGMGSVSEAFEIGTGKAGVYKTALPEAKAMNFDISKGEGVVSPAFADAVAPNTTRRGQLFANTALATQWEKQNTTFIQDYLSPTMKALKKEIGDEGLTIAREAEMTRLAHQQYGNVVPEVYGTTPAGFIMEHAGVPVPVEETVKALTWMKETWGKQIKEGGVGSVHQLDPQIGNIMKKGDRYMMTDWGVASLTPMSDRAQKAAMDVYDGYIRIKQKMVSGHQQAVRQASKSAKYAGKGHTKKSGVMPVVEVPTFRAPVRQPTVKTLVGGKLPGRSNR